MTVSVIVAVARNGVIGDKNSLLWHISEDLQRFKQLTRGHSVIMGRRTFESIGRPLPERTNIVVTRGDAHFEGCLRAGSLEEALKMCEGEDEVFVIGGAQIYAQALPTADRLYITVVDRDYAGDTTFPEWDRDEWRLVSRDHFDRGEKYEYPFAFELYERR